MTAQHHHIAHFYLRQNPPEHNLSPHKICIAGLLVILHQDTGKSRICDRLWTSYDSTLTGLTAKNSAPANQIKNAIEPTSSICNPAYLGEFPCVHLSLSERLRRLKPPAQAFGFPNNRSAQFSDKSQSFFGQLKQRLISLRRQGAGSARPKCISLVTVNGRVQRLPALSRKSYAGTPCETSKSNPVEIRRRGLTASRSNAPLQAALSSLPIP